jgi:hypothetical protein
MKCEREREKRCEAKRGQRETALVMAAGFRKIEGQWANSSTKIQSFSCAHEQNRISSKAGKQPSSLHMQPNKYIQFKCSEKIMNKNHQQRLVSIIIHFFPLESMHVLYKLQLSLHSGKREGNVLQSHPPTHQLLYFIWLVLLWGNQYQPHSQEKNSLPMTSWATVLL